MCFEQSDGPHTCKVCRPCALTTLSFLTVNALNSLPLPGATYRLYDKNRLFGQAVSDAQGRVRFDGLRAGWYSLLQCSAPIGYRPHDHGWLVQADDCGDIWVDSVAGACFSVCNTGGAQPKPPTDPDNQSLQVAIVDMDVTDIELLDHRTEDAVEGYNITVFAKNYPGYELISVASHTFYNVQKDENWFFKYRKQ